MGLQSTVVCDLVGLKQLPIAMAWVLFITGIGRIIANPFIGRWTVGIETIFFIKRSISNLCTCI